MVLNSLLEIQVFIALEKNEFEWSSDRFCIFFFISHSLEIAWEASLHVNCYPIELWSWTAQLQAQLHMCGTCTGQETTPNLNFHTFKIKMKNVTVIPWLKLWQRLNYLNLLKVRRNCPCILWLCLDSMIMSTAIYWWVCLPISVYLYLYLATYTSEMLNHTLFWLNWLIIILNFP